MYTQTFKNCLLKVLKFEGGYVNDPDDPGGETVFGISRKFHPDWVGWETIDFFTTEEKKNLDLDILRDEPALFDAVSKFYYYKFYTRLKCDNIENLFSKLACNIFDFAVNAGIKTSAKTLQKAINKACVDLHMTNILEDGIIGNKTLEKLNIIIAHDYNKAELLHYFKELRILYYIDITKKRPVFLKYLKGWTDRAINA